MRWESVWRCEMLQKRFLKGSSSCHKPYALWVRFLARRSCSKRQEVLQQTSGTKSDGRDWMRTMLEYCLLLSVEQLVFSWRSRRYYISMLDKECFLSTHWSWRGGNVVLRVTSVPWYRRIEAAEEDVQRKWNVGGCGAALKVRIQDFG